MQLTPEQKQQLIDYLKIAKYNDNKYIFGPASSRELQNLYQILNIIGSGYCSDRIDKSRINDEKSPMLVYVMHKQAEKLLVVLSEITGRTIPDLTTNSQVIPIVQIEPSSKKQRKNGYDFGDLLK